MSQRSNISRLAPSPAVPSKMASSSKPASSKPSTPAKRVSINPNPVTIPAATTDQAPVTATTTNSAATTVKGTIPVTDASDPKKVKNVIVSVASPVATEHSYANNEKGNSRNATNKTDSSSDTSSSTSSESSSSEESEMEDLQHLLGAAAVAASQLRGTPTKRARGRPRKNASQQPATPTPASTPKANPPTTPTEANSDSKNRKRGRGCGSCPGCLRDDCGKCQYCMDKPKFGGPGRKKQRCSLRVCSNFVAAPGVKNSTHTPEAAMLASTGAKIAAASTHALATPTRPVEEIKESAIIPSAPPPSLPPAPSPLKKQTKSVAAPPPPPPPPPSSTPAVPSSSSAPPQHKNTQNFRKSDEGTQEPPSTASLPTSTTSSSASTMMKCYQCGRERKLSIARTSKFCTQRCLKQWEERHQGKNPDDAEPVSSTAASELFLPPPGQSRSTPRAVRNLRIDMAYPGTVLHHTGDAPASTPQVNPAPEPPEPALTNGVKRASQEVAAIPSKKAKEVAEAPTPPTKTRKKTSNEPYNLPVDVRKWSVKDVTHYFDSTLDCRQYSAVLEEQEVDGPALLLITSDTLVKCLGIKLGPALKVMMHVERLKAQQQALLS